MLQNEQCKISNEQILVFTCSCDTSKAVRIVFDGGSSGKYAIEYCQKCYDQDDKQFMILEEPLE